MFSYTATAKEQEKKKPRRVQTQRLADLTPAETKNVLAESSEQEFDYSQAAKAERLRDLTEGMYVVCVIYVSVAYACASHGIAIDIC